MNKRTKYINSEIIKCKILNFNYLINCFNLCFTTKQVTHYYMLLLFQSTFVKTKSKNLYVRFDSNQPKFHEKNVFLMQDLFMEVLNIEQSTQIMKSIMLVDLTIS